jgi:6-phosphogluconate dehydrogenase (decarboxylating)
MMIPGGKVTNDFVGHLCTLVEKGDIIIDAANAGYADSIANHNALAGRGASYLDVGFGGGPNAARNQNAILMIGGSETAYEEVEDVFRVVAGEGNYGFVGGPGAGQAMKGATNTKFYADLVLIAEMYKLIQTISEESGMDIHLNETYRLASRIPHITYEAMKAGADALINGEIPEDAPALKISDQVKAMVERAKKLGVPLPGMEAVLNEYPNVPLDERRLIKATKLKITGH